MARLKILPATGASVLLAALAGAGAARAEIVHAHYAITFAGLRIGDANATGIFEPTTLPHRPQRQTHGTRGPGRQRAHGARLDRRLSPQHARPLDLRHDLSSNSRETRTVRMALNAGTVRAVEIMPPFEDKTGRIPVTEANKRNVLDPTSALIMPVAAGEPLVGPAACNRTLPVFDGFARYDIALLVRRDARRLDPRLFRPGLDLPGQIRAGLGPPARVAIDALHGRRESDRGVARAGRTRACRRPTARFADDDERHGGRRCRRIRCRAQRAAGPLIRLRAGSRRGRRSRSIPRGHRARAQQSAARQDRPKSRTDCNRRRGSTGRLIAEAGDDAHDRQDAAPAALRYNAPTAGDYAHG